MDDQPIQITKKAKSRAFKALMWKNFIYCTRHFVIVPLQIAFPIVLFVLLAYTSNLLNDRQIATPQHDFNSSVSSEEYLYDSLHNRINKLYYYPHSEFIEKVMKSAGEKMMIPERKILRHLDVANFLKKSDDDAFKKIGTMIVIFEEDKDASTFHYTIRTKDFIDTTRVYVTSNAVPHTHYGSLYLSTVALQIAIDKSIIEMKSNSSVTDSISSQMFFYPPSEDKLAWREKYHYYYPIVTCISFMLGLLAILSALITEKASGIKVLMRMMGVNNNTLLVSHYVNYLIINTIIAIGMTLVIGLYPGEAFMFHSNKLIVFLFFFVFVNYVISLAFLFSTLFSRPAMGCLVLALFWIGSAVLSNRIIGKNHSESFLTLSCLVPNFALFLFYRNVGAYELKDVGIQFSNMHIIPAGSPNSLSILGILGMLLLDIILYLFLTWYIDQVNPGPYGIPKPWNFLFTKVMNRNHILPDISEQEEAINDDVVVEKFESVEPYISVNKLWKIFGSWNEIKTVALSDLSCNIHKGGITALLGHNGAGKTTLMSIITGMITPSSGTILIDGYDIKHDMKDIHSTIGFCPQENLTFAYLTVREHLLFFSMIKGYSLSECEKECSILLNNMNMTNKANEQCCNLSGGMKRRLQLAIALAGSSSLLILDEPTSGLDPETRRELWDILLELRSTRTILLTTHSMEEADALGNRVLIIDHGKLKCYGTPMFLKSVYQTGYKLHIFKETNFDKDSVCRLIKDIVVNEMWIEDNEKIVFNLPFEVSSKFIHLFEELQVQKELYGIKQIRLLTTSLEDVFLKVTTVGTSDNITPKCRSNQLGSQHLTTNALWNNNVWISQMKGLLQRKWYFMKNHQRFTALLQIILAIAILIPLFINHNNIPDIPSLKLDLSLYNRNKLIIYMNENINYKSMHLYLENYNVEIITSSDVLSDTLNVELTNKGSYGSNLIIGVDYDRSSKTYNALYSTSVLHAHPVAVNFVTNLLANILLTPKHEPYFSVSVHPLPISMDDQFAELTSLEYDMIVYVSVISSIALCLLLTIAVSFPIDERISQSRVLNMMSGVNPILYWFCTWIFDMIIMLTLSMTVYFTTMYVYWDHMNMGGGGCPLWVVKLTIIILYWMSGLGLVYFMSYFFKNSAVGFLVIFTLNIVVGIMIPYITQVMSSLENVKYWKLISPIGVIFPPFNLVYSYLEVGQTVQFNERCITLYKKYNYTISDTLCCDKKQDNTCKGLRNYISDEDSGIWPFLVFMLSSFILYTLFIFLLEFKSIEKFVTWIVYKHKGHMIKSNKRTRSSRNSTETSDTLTGLTLSKIYKSNPFKDPFLAVNNVDIEVKKGECVGLLGINGAGKTTLFKLITGCELPSQGDCSINTYSLNRQRKKYLSSLGYCPQFDAIDRYMTGRQILTLFCQLRGVRTDRIQQEVQSMLDLTGLTKVADRYSSDYSGGTRRRLSAAVSLIGYKDFVLLDEPTTGVDPGARSMFHSVLEKVMAQGRSLLLSSHNLNECEKLCDQLAIMNKGCILHKGTVSDLKAIYATGYILNIKLITGQAPTGVDVVDGCSMSHLMPMSTSDANKTNINKLKHAINKQFTCILRDEHSNILQYHLKTNLFFGELFRKMESIASDYRDIIEMYTIADTSLEELFLIMQKSENIDTLHNNDDIV